MRREAPYWSQFIYIDFLKKYYIGHDKIGQVDIYLINNSQDFYDQHPKQSAELLFQCEKVQDSVWNKRHTTFSNTFEVGALLLLISNNVVCGFMSGKELPNTSETLCIYFSDAMFLPVIQNKGLCSLSFAILHRYFYQKKSAVQKENLNLVISGNIATFKFFLNPTIALRKTLDFIQPHQSKPIMDFVRKDFADKQIDENGVIKAAWMAQKQNTVDVWPENIVKKFNLPVNLDYRSGDALLGIFRLEVSGVRSIYELIQSRLHNSFKID